jgi:uncharacterized protein YbbC (DUF1343 family)
MRLVVSCALAIAVLLLALPRLTQSSAVVTRVDPPVSLSEIPLQADPSGYLGGVDPERVGVLTGAEVLLRDSLHLARGKRVGLITNPTALTREGRHTIDLLHDHPEVDLAVLFAPEHGLRGGIDAGVRIADGVDRESGLPVRSLYGQTVQPTRQMLRDLDVLMFDMLDISARTYTYIWTMTLAMEAAAQAGIPFIVLDRPNPVTGRVGGPLPTLEALRTGPRITGHYPVPFRHGMTPGEIARYVNSEYRVNAALAVVPVVGWKRSDWYDATGLPWVNPSPNIRSLDAALNFAGLGSLEATALSLGRGTAEPFSVVGAPWLNSQALLGRLAAYPLEGVTLEPTRFTPSGDGWMQFRGQTVPGVRITVTDRDRYDPSFLALVLLAEIYRLHPRQLGMNAMKHVLDDWTTDEIRRGTPPTRIAERWTAAAQDWQSRTVAYRIYD